MNKGFTLIEILIYIVLFSLIMITVMSFAVSIIFSEQNSNFDIYAEEEIFFIEKKFEWALSSGEIMRPAPGETSSLLEIKIQNDTVKFDLLQENDNGYLRLKRGSSDAEKLNGENIKISDLNFFHFQNNDGNKYLKVNFKVNILSNSQEFEKIKKIN